jgi:hypothetical protein
MAAAQRSVEERYQDVAQRFTPDGYLDAVTWVLLNMVAAAAFEQSRSEVAGPKHGEAVSAFWSQELFRLVIDGYLLGRLEGGTEEQLLRFADTSSGPTLEAVKFLVVARGVIAAVLENRQSSEPSDDFKPILREFALGAMGRLRNEHAAILDDEAEARPFGEAAASALHLGREVAKVESACLGDSDFAEGAMRELAKPQMKRRLDEVVDMIRGRGIEDPVEWVPILFEGLRSQPR